MQSGFDTRPRADGGIERRSSRRDDVETALGDMLDAVRRDASLDAVAVSDASGVLVAGAGAFRTCEELAALAPLSDRASAANDTVPTRLDVIMARMEVRRFRIDGVDVLVSASGEGAAAEALARAAAGCARILSSSGKKRPR